MRLLGAGERQNFEINCASLGKLPNLCVPLGPRVKGVQQYHAYHRVFVRLDELTQMR